MSLNKRTALLFDSNFFHVDEQKPFNSNKLNLDSYSKFDRTLEFLRLDETIDIYIPELVLCEEISHHKRKFKKLNKSVTVTDDYYNILKLHHLPELNMIPIPSDKKKLFKDIFKMALDKQPPFSDDEEYDRGFKDSIILLSLFEFAKFHSYDEYMLVTNDKGFIKNTTSIQKFLKKYVSSIRKINEKSLTIMNLDNFKVFYDKYNIFSDLREYLDKKFFYEIDDNYSRSPYIFAGYDYPIYSHDILYDKTRIYQLDENLYEVEIFISVTPEYNDDSIPYLGEDISQWESYYFEKTTDGWKYYLDDYRYEIDYEPST